MAVNASEVISQSIEPSLQKANSSNPESYENNNSYNRLKNQSRIVQRERFETTKAGTYNQYDPYYHTDSSTNKYNKAGTEDERITTGGELKYLYPSSERGDYALQASALNGIFGIPYQFMTSVDRRIFPSDENSLGRKYAEKIMTHAPLLMLTPCRQKFMEGFSSSDRNMTLASLIEGNTELIRNNLNRTGRYYTTKFAYNEYYKAVRVMCKEVAHFLGIDDVMINYGNSGTKVKIGDIDWYSMKNESFSNYFACKNAVVLYADGLVNLSDSFSNSTTDSSIASSINSFSDQAKELKFLLGGNSALTNIYETTKDSVSGALSSLSGLGGDLTAGMLGDLAGTGVSTVMAGGKLIFPKIWGDSNSSRSYSFDIKLRSPDHDTISIYFNVLVPYLHLLALCLPQSLTSGTAAQSPNAYDTPFLVRAYCKGMFNINMGIITDLSATRGAESQWNDQGLPTQIDVSISIEDMYSNLVMSNPHKEDGNFISNILESHFDVITNTEMIDFLSNLSGLNIAAQSATRKLELFYELSTSGIKWVPSQIYHYFENGVSNVIRNIHDRLM